jgi:hypothetical protein
MTTFARALKLSPASRESSTPREPAEVLAYYASMGLVIDGRRDDTAAN